jgi:hypothetical protein
MRLLIPIFLLVALVGCASPFRTVYTSPDGDHYIEESAAQGRYYIPDSIMYAGIGFDPWWITVNPALTFIYYIPGYYPYYLSAWYRLVYQPYYGYYPGYYSHWCPPYRMRHGLPPGHAGRIADGSVPAASIPGPEITGSRDLRRFATYKSYNPAGNPGIGQAYKASGPNRPTTAFRKAPVKPSWSAPGKGMSQSPGFASPSSRPTVLDRSLKTSSLPVVRDKQ